MHRPIVAGLVSLLLASCQSVPRSGLPDGTYVAAAGADTLVIDGRRISMYLPAMYSTRRLSLDGRDFTFTVLPGGGLRIWGSSNDAYFLQIVSDCDWRWSSPAIECVRKDGSVIRFVRDYRGDPRPPPMPQQRVWLAAATHLRAKETQGATGGGTLPIYHRTTFPPFRFALTQLEKQARAGFCGLPREEATGVVRSLHWQNKEDRAIGDLFDHRPGFEIKTGRRQKRDQVGLSDVVFDRAGTAAYLNISIGPRSGSIIRFELRDDAWHWAGECAQWISWR
jgi:hypothetical protein